MTSGRPEGLIGKGMKGRARARAPTVQTDRNSADVTRKGRARGGGVRAHVPRDIAIRRNRKRTEDTKGGAVCSSFVQESDPTGRLFFSLSLSVLTVDMEVPMRFIVVRTSVTTI